MSLAETAINTFLDRKLAQSGSGPIYPATQDRSVAKGLLVGLFAGLAATAAKAAVERVYPPDAGEIPVTNWALGVASGAAYGALAEFYPAATGREGVTFGMTVMALTHEAGPAALANMSRREKTSEVASHIVFGLVAEGTRRFLRKRM